MLSLMGMPFAAEELTRIRRWWFQSIADMLVRIRNANMAEKQIVQMPHSKMKSEVLAC